MSLLQRSLQRLESLFAAQEDTLKRLHNLYWVDKNQKQSKRDASEHEWSAAALQRDVVKAALEQAERVLQVKKDAFDEDEAVLKDTTCSWSARIALVIAEFYNFHDGSSVSGLSPSSRTLSLPPIASNDLHVHGATDDKNNMASAAGNELHVHGATGDNMNMAAVAGDGLPVDGAISAAGDGLPVDGSIPGAGADLHVNSSIPGAGDGLPVHGAISTAGDGINIAPAAGADLPVNGSIPGAGDDLPVHGSTPGADNNIAIAPVTDHDLPVNGCTPVAGDDIAMAFAAGNDLEVQGGRICTIMATAGHDLVEGTDVLLPPRNATGTSWETSMLMCWQDIDIGEHTRHQASQFSHELVETLYKDGIVGEEQEDSHHTLSDEQILDDFFDCSAASRFNKTYI